MDSQARNKALFRAKLHAHGKDKRIESPLVRYNESEQPVCRVCNVLLKSESLWDAHQASRKHHEAISNLKAAAAASTPVNNAKSDPRKDLSKSKPEHLEELQKPEPERSRESPKPHLSSALPPDFFDNNDARKTSTRKGSVQSVDPDSYKAGSAKAQVTEPLNRSGSFSETEVIKPASSEAKQVKGALPEGFFDNKEADLRARGIKLVKPDVKDEYKEFEKVIQEDLQQVDNRMEEDEFDAAEMIEEAESVEQRSYWEKVELLKKKKMELKAARSAKRSKVSEVVKERPSHEDSSSDDDSDENFALDWRAQHL
ncbi:hypothetical protein UlMin_023951 [Ulmus minor]